KSGARDTSYAPTIRFRSGAHTRVEQVIVQPDGKAVVLGLFDQANGIDRTHLARFHPDGSLDTQFDPGDGLQEVDGTYYRALALNPDGSVLLGGSFRTSADASAIGIARLWGDASPLRLVLRPAAAGLRLSLLGGERATYALEASTDLQHWVPMATLTNHLAARPNLISDPEGVLRAFRARLLP
ncbi:MAG: delta-60 repeat domain-containing protein, partial [Verrucomicrobiales bacterium]|nr:delta-60 repeat domain-containing protein [Verrucomicrobiales bacterium]